MATHQIKGYVKSEKGQQPIPKLRIEAWDKDLLIDDFLGAAISDEKGYFSIDFREEFYQEIIFDRKPDIYFKVWKGDQMLLDTQKSVRWNVKIESKPVTLFIKDELVTDIGEFEIKGTIVDENGTLLAGVKVVAYDKDLRTDELLGQATTNADGYYEIYYNREQFQKVENAQADLFIVVSDASGNLLATSDVFYNAANAQEINLTISSSASEWESLNNKLLPLLKNQKKTVETTFIDLPPDELVRADIVFLSKETNAEENNIRLWSMSYNLELKVKTIQAEVFYGWLREGQPELPEELWNLTTDELISSLQKAITDKIIPASVEGMEDKIKASIDLLRNNLENAPLIDIIDAFTEDFGTRQDLMDSFTKIYLENKGDWSAIKPILANDANFPPETLTKVFYTQDLSDWSNNNKALIYTFQKDNSLNSLWDIGFSLNKSKLHDKIPDAAVPDKETKDTYTAKLYTGLYHTVPTAVIVNMINDPDIQLGNTDIGKHISDIFTQAHGFNITTNSVYDVINTSDLLKKLPEETKNQVITEMKTLQRITLISPVPEAIPALINKNYNSAYSITELPAAQFIANMKSESLSDETFSSIYTEAAKRKIMNEQKLLKIKEAGDRSGIKMIDGELRNTGVNEVDPAVQAILENNNLSWDLLFGDADFCECDECSSVYSATAYYVDLLQYLRNNNIDPAYIRQNPNDISGTPLAYLFARRPDLGHLQLTCTNTNIILPYVDLVNEIMEQYVAFKTTRAFNVTDETSSELLSAPQHMEQDHAYQSLSNTVFPFTLPYNQPIDAARVFLNYLNSSRFELIDTFRKNNVAINYDNAVDAEFLGLTEEEYGIITKKNFSGSTFPLNINSCYGLLATDSLSVLELVKKEFLPRTGIEYSDLIELLQMQIVNPSAGSKNLDLTNKDTCNLDDTKLIVGNNSQPEIIYSIIHRFIRLWRKLGFTMDEVDKAIMALGSGDIAPELIHQLVAVKKLLGVTGIELTKLLCFWADISTAGENSLYKQLFLTHNALGIDKVFEPVNGQYLTGNPKISEHLPVLMATLNLSSDDITAIMNATAMADLLTISNLSMLYRYRLISKVLGLRISTFISMLPLFGNVFRDADSTVEFMDHWTKMEDDGFTYQQLNYMIRNVDDDKKPFEPSKTAILQLTKTLYDGLNAIDNAHQDLISTTDLTDTEQATTELVRTKASLLFDTGTVEKIVGLLEGSNVFTTNAPDNLTLTITNETLNKKLKYINKAPGASSIQITGILTVQESNDFKVLSNDNDWIPALTRIEKQQKKLFNELLLDVFTNEKTIDAANKAILSNTIQEGDIIIPLSHIALGQTDTNTAPDKRLAFLKIFLPYLRQQLAHRFIIGTLSGFVGLDAKITDLLVSEILQLGNPLTSVYDIFEKIKDSSIPDTGNWSGYLVPVSDAPYTFIVTNSNASPAINIDGTDIAFTQQDDPTNEWWSANLGFQTGKLYKLTTNVSLANILWKTATSDISPIPSAVLIPDLASGPCKLALVALKKAAILAVNFNLSADEIRFLNSYKSNFDNLDFNNITLVHWLRLDAYTRLRNSLPQNNVNILDFWAWVNSTNPPSDPVKLSEKINELTNWKKGSIDKFISVDHFNILQLTDYGNEKNLLKLQQAFAVADKIGMDINFLFEWAVPSSDFNTCKAIADSIQKAIRAQYNQTDWEEIIKPLNDKLRNNQKNALIAYLLQQPEIKAAGLTDANGLFEYFLIDVQMDTCMETSRIKQAISSVQLFIQRCFLGLEQDIAPSLLDRNRWEWMEMYTVWEANRKVFLYPENWIESNLRDDKSTFFKELESELLQKDINKQNVTDALKNYLYKVDEVANMEVVGLYIEGEFIDDFTRAKGSKLHVFSRTHAAPYFFYYRYLAMDEDMNWYPWEKVQVDIPSYDVEDMNGLITGNGCYLTPVVWNGRLLVFFPQFVKKTKPNPDGSVLIRALADQPVDNLKPIEFWEIKMAWSEYKNGKWTQKQLGKGPLYQDLENAKDEDPNATNALNAPQNGVLITIGDISNFKFVPVLSDDSTLLAIVVYYDKDAVELGMFEFNGNNLQPPTKTYTASNPVWAGYFQYDGSAIAHSNIGSLQTSGNQGYLFQQANGVVNFTNIRFYHPFVKNLLGIINAGNAADFFKFNLSIGTTEDGQIIQDDIDDAFGNSPRNSGIPFYHELKRPYSLYNWEMFFHTPIMLAVALSKAQQFEEAMKWFHYVFNPIADGIDDKRFWQFLPFKTVDSISILEQIFNNLLPNTPDAAISEWRNNPFKPHVVARSRPVAYMKWVVMKYIDNILDWGDYLFRQDTIESINQATQLYVLAGHILGPKPMVIPKRGEFVTETYLSLLNKWDAFSNAMSELEVITVYRMQSHITQKVGVIDVPTLNIFGSATALYFCLPKNPVLLGYWDTLADRLFKIRHCQNIEGVFRMLPLFDPPIDPALLVKAAAQGLSIASVVNDLNSAMPNYRFYYLLQKALELCNELKSLGASMLSAIEKKDNESISLIRARHESTMNNLVMEMKKLQLAEAQSSLDSLLQNRKTPEYRMKYYLQLVGEDIGKVPALDSEFSEIPNSLELPVAESGLKLIRYEKEDMDKANEAAILQIGVGIAETFASLCHALPTSSADGKPYGIGAGTSWGFPNLANATSAAARGLKIIGDILSFQSAQAAKKGSFQRALQERLYQANAAGYEIKQIDKQITAQQIRIDMANQDITNQQKQIDNSNEIEDFLKNKYTNEELYTWMRGSLKTLYRQVYSIAYDLAKKAEKTYCFERGISNANFIQPGYFDAGREGLLAGEQLYVGLKQLEAAYQEKRGYDYEITKHFSLSQLDPLALLKLKTAFITEFELPEVLFDLDYPGHFKRRIKSISISIPCVAGPYTGVNATLRLLNNKFRNSSVANNYPEKTDEQDDRFMSYNIPITAIATSSAQNDSGMFELNFKDERYLPFEGAGAISRWSLELPSIKQFDYNTIADVILHVRYVASEGGEQLKKSALNAVKSQINQINQQLSETGLHIPISLKHEMPNEWNLLVKNQPVNIIIDKTKLPYMAQLTATIEHIMFVVKVKNYPSSFTLSNNGSAFAMTTVDDLKLYTHIETGNSFKLTIGPNDSAILDELILVVKYSF
jgi:hypothetical protein